MSWDREKEKKAARTWHKGMSVVAVIFGIFWCLAAVSMGAWFMLIFGIPFVGLLIYRLAIVSKIERESSDSQPRQQAEPWELPAESRQERGNGFCPYCGSAVEDSFEYCPKCGRKLK